MVVVTVVAKQITATEELFVYDYKLANTTEIDWQLINPKALQRLMQNSCEHLHKFYTVEIFFQLIFRHNSS